MDFDSIEKLRRKYPNRITRGKAIKLYCKELCCCGDNNSWKNCSVESCFLHSFRTGREITQQKKVNEKKEQFSSINSSKMGCRE
jgi:hypothetical protein